MTTTSDDNPPIVFIDTETDGTHDTRQAWDVGMIRRDERGEFTMSFFVEINLENADVNALRIGGYYDRHPRGRFISGQAERPLRSMVKSTSEAAELVAQWTHDAVVVGAVTSFDTHLLERLLRSHGYCPTWSHRLVCVESMVLGRLGRIVKGLAKCGEALGIDTEQFERHTALGDAQLAQAIFDKLTASQLTGGVR